MGATSERGKNVEGFGSRVSAKVYMKAVKYISTQGAECISLLPLGLGWGKRQPINRRCVGSPHKHEHIGAVNIWYHCATEDFKTSTLAVLFFFPLTIRIISIVDGSGAQAILLGEGIL